MNGELSAVDATPSGPPSSSRTWPSSQTDRRPSAIAPGVTASAEVETEQIAPTAVSAVAAHGTANAHVNGTAVPWSLGDEPFWRSVIVTATLACSWPV